MPPDVIAAPHSHPIVVGVPWTTILGGHDVRPCHHRACRPGLRPRRRRRRLPGSRGAGARGGLGGPPGSARRDLVDRRPARRRGHRATPGLARRAGAFRRADRRAGGLRRRRRRRGLHDRDRRRDGGQQPRPGRPASHVRQPGWLPRAAHPRLDRPGSGVGGARRPRSTADAGPGRLQVRHDDGAERVHGLCLGARRGRTQGRPAPRLRPPGRFLRAHHGSGQERRGPAPSRRRPRGLPQPARHRGDGIRR